MRTALLTLTMCVLALPANANYSGGTGEPNDPYQIATAADLIALGETPDDYDKHFILTADIDLDPNLPGRKVFDNAVIAGAWKLPFTGVFDGNGRTISHLTVVGTSSLGLFGQLGWNFQGQSYGEPTCTVTNLALENVDIVGSESSAGALAAYIEWAVVSHSRSTGKVSGKSPVGGLVGYNQHAVIHCHSGCTVTGGSDVGGLVGNNNGSVANCYSTGTVNGGSAVGGLVGWHRGSITQSFSTGVVSGKDAVGGLVGRNGIDLIPRRVLQPGDIDRSYSTASVRGETYVGGLIGDDRCGSVRQCYSTGAVSGSAQVGGLIGGLAWSLDVTTSFWDVEISGLTVSSAGQGKTTAQMRTANTFLNAGWDFVGETANGTEDIWRISEGRDYPRLSWERVLEDDFEDGEAGSLWLAYEPDASKIRVLEKGGRLEVHASAQADNIDAAYVSNGWRLDVAEDFALRVDFHCGKRDVGDSWVMVALLPSLEEPVSRIITFEAGCMNEQPFFLYEAIDGFWRHEEESDRSSDDGTLYVSYDAARDELYLSHTGYGKANAWRTVAGLLGDRWQGEPVYVAIGGGSDGVILEPGDAWLDDFIISSGTLVSAKSDGTGDSDD